MQMKILLPVDGSEYTKRMLAYVAAHDELLGGDHEYFVLTVVPSIPATWHAFWTAAHSTTTTGMVPTKFCSLSAGSSTSKNGGCA